jgi:hypothetical protein
LNNTDHSSLPGFDNTFPSTFIIAVNFSSTFLKDYLFIVKPREISCLGREITRAAKAVLKNKIECKNIFCL